MPLYGIKKRTNILYIFGRYYFINFIYINMIILIVKTVNINYFRTKYYVIFQCDDFYCCFSEDKLLLGIRSVVGNF